MSHDRLKCRNITEASGVFSRSDPRVLILEDEVLIAIDLQETLKELGLMDIVTCHRLDDALAAANSQSFDLAFLDHMIGAFSSINIGHALDRSGTQVVFTSGSDRSEVAALPHASVFLAKPYSERQIKAVVDRVVNDARTGQPETPQERRAIDHQPQPSAPAPTPAGVGAAYSPKSRKPPARTSRQ